MFDSTPKSHKTSFFANELTPKKSVLIPLFSREVKIGKYIYFCREGVKTDLGTGPSDWDQLYFLIVCFGTTTCPIEGDNCNLHLCSVSRDKSLSQNIYTSKGPQHFWPLRNKVWRFYAENWIQFIAVPAYQEKIIFNLNSKLVIMYSGWLIKAPSNHLKRPWVESPYFWAYLILGDHERYPRFEMMFSFYDLN